MKIRALISAVLILLSQVSVPALAESKTKLECELCQIAIIKKGQIAPFDGFLYNNVAHADTRSQIKVAEDRFKLKLDRELGLQKLRLQYTTATTAISLNACEARHKEIVGIKNSRIKDLENSLVQADDKSKGGNGILYFSLGVAGGIVVSALAIWGASSLGKAID